EICLFFQAEDGIRAFHVTGVQTCALPISLQRHPAQQGSTSTQHLLELSRALIQCQPGREFILHKCDRYPLPARKRADRLQPKPGRPTGRDLLLNKRRIVLHLYVNCERLPGLPCQADYKQDPHCKEFAPKTTEVCNKLRLEQTRLVKFLYTMRMN